MSPSCSRSVKYIDFNHLILLSWNICNTSIVDLVKLSKIVTPHKLRQIFPSSEFFILSTCNRVEIYIYSDTPQAVFQSIKQFIVCESPGEEYFSDSGVFLEGMQAYLHLIKVTSGLNSLAVGEYQIQGQVKDAYKNAIRDRYIWRYLISIIESALRTGKRVRSETGICHNSGSLSFLAIDMMLQVNKPMKELPILIVGTGRMCNLAAEYFIKIGYESIIFFSNEPDERGTIKLKYKALVLPISALPERTRENNIIFSAVSPDTTRIYIESLGENWDTFSIIDLSVPKYIFRSDSDTSNVYLLDMEGVQHIAPDYLPG
ncbi:uncharacterized protein METZ01_LOCUS350066, partial [marine metagenome]